jgi:heme/copper-type cytochrome/quinol oxidase subunit 4
MPLVVMGSADAGGPALYRSKMSAWVRAIIGFTLGLLLTLVALFLSGAGHGTYVPMTANVSVMIFISRARINHAARLADWKAPRHPDGAGEAALR